MCVYVTFIKTSYFLMSANLNNLWRINDAKSNKHGPRHKIAFVRRNPNYEESVKMGKPQHEFKTGKTYTGDWVKNKREGFGSQTWPSGNKYEGDWSGNKRHGKGTLWVKIKGKLRKQYTGDWVNNARDGVGILYYTEGHKYEGEWRKGARYGRGKMTYASGDVYEGDWVDDVRSGLGVLTMANGDRYEGHWLADKKEGPGRYFYRSTGKMYEGEWVDGSPKCGAYSNIPVSSFDDAYARSGYLGNQDEGAVFELPSLGLSSADNVLGAAVSSVRRSRAAERGEAAIATSTGVFTQDEIDQLKRAFDSVDREETGFIPAYGLEPVLRALGMDPIKEDIEALLAELGIDMDGTIQFVEFAGVLARLKV